MENLEVQFNEEKSIVIIKERVIKVDKIIIKEMIDIPSDKIVYVNTEGLPGRIVLWQDDQYDAIGQWTNQDVINRINELYA